MKTRTARLVPALLACLAWSPVGALAGVGAADDQPWPLSENKTDTVYLLDGDPMFGSVENEQPDGSFDFTSTKGATLHFGRDKVDRIERRRLAQAIVEHNAEILIKKKDPAALIRTLEFGVEKGAAPAADAALRQALTAMPGDTDLAVFAFKRLTDPKDIEKVARDTLKKSDLFEPAYTALAKVLLDADRLDELDQVVKTWLGKRPTSEPANRLMAAAAEKRGDLRTAAECYRKGRDLHKNAEAALGYARCALKLDDYENAQKGAAQLLDGADGDQAAAIAGAAQLALGQAAQALPLLTRGAAAQLPPDLAAIARYDLGLAKWRTGDQAGARQVWQQAMTPETQLALAILEHQPLRDPQSLTHPRLRAIALEHNACLDLERKDPAKAMQALGTGSSKRHVFLRAVADALARNGDEAAVRALAATPGVESLRWQAYAHLLANRWKDAEVTLARLPADDGWAAAYRVYLAAAQRDESKARAEYQKLVGMADGPKEYIARLAAEYEVADDARDIEEFDWPEGERLGTGWQADAPGTNITVRAKQGRLVLEGAQTASKEPVSRAWRVVPTARLRGAQVEFEISGLGQAYAGIELTDDARANGVELAIAPDRYLAWRGLANGTWTAWERIALQIPGAKPTLRIEYQNGRVFAVQPDNAANRFALGERAIPAPAPDSLRLGVFGVAEPGTTWAVGAETFELQLKPADKR